jgi:colicin import membrane protein
LAHFWDSWTFARDEGYDPLEVVRSNHSEFEAFESAQRAQWAREDEERRKGEEEEKKKAEEASSKGLVEVTRTVESEVTETVAAMEATLTPAPELAERSIAATATSLEPARASASIVGARHKGSVPKPKSAGAKAKAASKLEKNPADDVTAPVPADKKAAAKKKAAELAARRKAKVAAGTDVALETKPIESSGTASLATATSRPKVRRYMHTKSLN